MVDDVEIPDVQFWGLAVRSDSPATYSIENEDGLMELCHVTNVALASHQETAAGPIFVKVKSPADGKSYTIGALLPGKQYSFSTDLMISPDTEFSVSGIGAEVHLTGYRSINAESVVIDDDDDEEEVSDEEDSDDHEFVVPDDVDEEDEDDEDESEDDDAMEEDNGQLNGHKLAAKLGSKVQSLSNKKRAQALTKRDLVSRLGDALEDDSDDDDDADVASSDLETSDDDEQESDPDARVHEIAQAEATAKRFKAEKARQKNKRAIDPEAEDEFEVLDEDDLDDNESEDDDDDDGDDILNDLTESMKPQKESKKGSATPPAAAPQAQSSLKRQLEAETARPAKKSKKVTPEALGAAPSSAPAEAAGAKPLPPHPDAATTETREYVGKLVEYLREHGGSAKMSVIGAQLRRPPKADKLGKILKIYDTWFKKSGQKGQEDMLLQSKLR